MTGGWAELWELRRTCSPVSQTWTMEGSLKSDGDGSLMCRGNCRRGCEENFTVPWHLGVPHKGTERRAGNRTELRP